MHHWVKAVVRMEQQVVLFLDAVENVIAHQFRHRLGRHGRVFQLGPFDHAVYGHHQLIQIQRTGDTVALLPLNVQPLHQPGQHFLAHAFFRFQPHHLTAAAHSQHFPHSAFHALWRAFRQLEILVAQDAEHAAMLHRFAGEQGVDMMTNHILQADQALIVLRFRKVVDTRQRRGQRHQREAAPPAPAAGQLDAQMQLFLADRRVLRQFLQKGQDGVVEQLLFPVGLGMAQ